MTLNLEKLVGLQSQFTTMKQQRWRQPYERWAKSRTEKRQGTVLVSSGHSPVLSKTMYHHPQNSQSLANFFCFLKLNGRLTKEVCLGHSFGDKNVQVQANALGWTPLRDTIAMSQDDSRHNVGSMCESKRSHNKTGCEREVRKQHLITTHSYRNYTIPMRTTFISLSTILLVT